MNSLLQWELDWVMANADRYGCLWHAKAVCGNITKRYHIAASKRLADDYRREPTDEHLNALLEHLENAP
jgi:hypothetical protein